MTGYNRGMTFGELGKYLEELEGVSSRLEMTRMLAKLFSEVSPNEGRLVAYLVQGRLGPAYANPNFGVADKMMVRALGEGAGELFRKLGDLGLAAEKLSGEASAARANHKLNSNVQIQNVYLKLTEIAEVGGKGSQEKKQELIGDLLQQMDPVSAKYAVKIILGKLRVGFSDMTVLDSLSWMVAGDKSLRPTVEAIYNVRADLGEVVELIKKHKTGPEIKKLQVTPRTGTPVLMARAERATAAGEIWKRNKSCAVEYKLDGIRIQAHCVKGKVVLFSRGLENVTEMYPDVVKGLTKQIRKECIIEGEMIAEDGEGNFLPFQQTAQRKRKYRVEEMSKKIPLVFYLFDVLAVEGKDVMREGNEKRRVILEGLVKTGGGRQTVRLIWRKTAKSAEEIDKYFEEAIARGTEGIVAKKLDGIYQAGSRDFNWIKYKKSYDASTLADTTDVLVMGYDSGQGKRAGFGMGAFLGGVYDKKTGKYYTVGKIGSGPSDEEWESLEKELRKYIVDRKPEEYSVKKQAECDYWVRPKFVVEVKADELSASTAMHSSGFGFRFPRFVKLRDKQPEDVTSLSEIERLYKMQKRK